MIIGVDPLLDGLPCVLSDTSISLLPVCSFLHMQTRMTRTSQISVSLSNESICWIKLNYVAQT